MIAANTGGARLIKYGDVRQNLLGLRAVLMHPRARNSIYCRRCAKEQYRPGFEAVVRR